MTKSHSQDCTLPQTRYKTCPAIEKVPELLYEDQPPCGPELSAKQMIFRQVQHEPRRSRSDAAVLAARFQYLEFESDKLKSARSPHHVKRMLQMSSS